MAKWDGRENSCSCNCGFDIPAGGTLDKLIVKDISGIANMIYPVGSIYMSVNSTSPSTLFGGSWTRIQDTFLLAAGSSYGAGSTGGNTSHDHLSPVGYNPSNKLFGVSYARGSNNVTLNATFAATGDTVTTSSGSYQWTFPRTSSESNMPPYLAVYVWQRIA